LFDNEIVPVFVAGARGQAPKQITQDEGPSKADFEKLVNLKPYFQPDGGSVTAGNASSINDGASAILITNRSKADQLGLPLLAIIRSFADASQTPLDFTTSPTLAIQLAVKRAGLQLSDIDYFEINEAFAVVALANIKLLGIDVQKVNVNGGAIALGHPLGSSGCRILVTLLSVLQQTKSRFGCAAVCNGGGGATAIVIERLDN
jgi:acetyl-CoA C-acetyltransferase